MATISLFPLKTRIRLTRELTHNYEGGSYDGFLGDSHQLLKEAGALVERLLILDPGTELRIEAFKSFASSENWPNVKVTVKPEGGKDTKLYIPLVAFDGVSWELIKETPKAPPAPIKRITVDFDSYAWGSEYGFKYDSIYHPAFGNQYNKGDGEKVINPLVFTEKEREATGFVVERDNNLAEVAVKIGKNSWPYTVVLKGYNYFKFKLGKGVTTASLDQTTHHVIIKSKYGNEEVAEKIYRLEEITKDSIKEFINTTLKEKHNL